MIDAGAKQALNPLVACFGPAQLDRALLDALCRLQRMSFYEAMQGNFAGMLVNAVTKSGTNEFHGGAVISHRNEAMAADTLRPVKRVWF